MAHHQDRDHPHPNPLPSREREEVGPTLIGLLLCVVLVPLIRATAFCSVDLVDLFQPADVTDVVSAGLVLPSRYAMAPEAARPLSLLCSPSSLTVTAGDTHGWRETGDDPRRMSVGSVGTTLSLRGDTMPNIVAAGISLWQPTVSFHEDGSEWSRASISARYKDYGAAIGRGAVRVGLALSDGEQNGRADSTRFRGIEPAEGVGKGFIAWDEEHSGFTAEAAKTCGRAEFGVLYSKGDGTLNARTIADGQGYFGDQSFKSERWSPYITWTRGATTDIALFGSARSRSSGPLRVGNLVVGRPKGDSSACSAAWARRREYADATRMLSLEFASATANFAGHTSAVFFPGLFTYAYKTDDHFHLDKLTARYGVERRRGSTALRWSVMLGYGSLDARLFASQAKPFGKRRVLIDEDWSGSSVWALSPAVGVGYRKSDWAMDAGLALFGGLLDLNDKRAGVVEPEPGKKRHSRWQPGYRCGITIRRAF